MLKKMVGLTVAPMCIDAAVGRTPFRAKMRRRAPRSAFHVCTPMRHLPTVKAVAHTRFHDWAEASPRPSRTAVMAEYPSSLGRWLWKTSWMEAGVPIGASIACRCSTFLPIQAPNEAHCTCVGDNHQSFHFTDAALSTQAPPPAAAR